MKFHKLEIEGLVLIEMSVHRDGRGFFVERYREDKFVSAGVASRFVQDNHSCSVPGVIRGLHYQLEPAQGKLVGVTRGRIWDVAVDIRPNSPTFGRHFATELSDENGHLLWVPGGFAHGFAVLGDEPADVTYKVDVLYAAAHEGGIIYSDPELEINWRVPSPSVSERDKSLVSFAEFKNRIDR